MAELFHSLDSLAQHQSPLQVLDYLVDHFHQQNDFARMFEARLMRKRFQLGLPLLPSGHLHLHSAAQKEYDAEMLAAAKDAARGYLQRGQIAESWPYYRALGDPAPVRQAIDELDPSAGTDAILEIALGERVHPLKGYTMLLAQHGICRAITLFEQYPDAATREDALTLVAQKLHQDLRDNLRNVIERNEGAAPSGDTIADLISNRDWLFGEFCYHIDVSHLMSVVRMCAESDRESTLRLGRDLARYGMRLHSELQYKGDPPFEDFYRDHELYLGARLGDNVDAAIAHFRARVASYDYEQIGTYPAQVLVRMLLKLGRKQEAVEVFERWVGDTDPNYLSCPSLPQLCQMAGDYERMRKLAEKDGDAIRYTAALLTPALNSPER